jgi:hypothetical protein
MIEYRILPIEELQPLKAKLESLCLRYASSSGQEALALEEEIQSSGSAQETITSGYSLTVGITNWLKQASDSVQAKASNVCIAALGRYIVSSSSPSSVIRICTCV